MSFVFGTQVLAFLSTERGNTNTLITEMNSPSANWNTSKQNKANLVHYNGEERH